MLAGTNSKIGICMIAVYFYPDIGGIQMTLLSLSRHLQEMGSNITVITRQTHDTPYFEEMGGIRVFRLDIPKDTPRIKAAIQFIFGSLKILKDQKDHYQIIHSHQLVTPTTIGLIAKTLFRKKLVLTPHTPSSAGAFYSLVHKRPITGKPRIAWMKRAADALVAISEEIKMDLHQLGFSSDKVSYIPNGVDTRHFSPITGDQKETLRQELGLPEGPIIICAGRLVQRKQIDVLIESFAMILPDLPDTASLVVLGDGEERANLEGLAATLGVSNQVLFMGAVLDTQKYLQAGDIFVIPSSIEGMPIILLEAMSCGLPCIGSEIGGIVDLIEDGKTGLLAVSGNISDLKEKISMLINDDQLSMKLSQAARNEVENHYSMDTTAKNHLNLFKRLLG